VFWSHPWFDVVNYETPMRSDVVIRLTTAGPVTAYEQKPAFTEHIGFGWIKISTCCIVLYQTRPI